MALKEIGYELREAYLGRLDGAVFVNGVAIPFFDVFVPNVIPDWFVVITDSYYADDSLKCGYGGDVHTTMDIVTRFRVGEGTSKIAELISGQIKGLLVPNTLVLPNFNIMNTINVMDKKINEETNTGRIIRKILTFKHTIQQLN